MRTTSSITTRSWLAESGAGMSVRIRETYGDAVRTTIPFFPPIHYLFHPDAVSEVLVRQSESIEKGAMFRRMLRSSFGNGLFTSEGPFWKRQRRLIQPVFHHVRINNFAERMVAHTTKMLDGWQDGATHTLDADMHALTLTIVVDALFSADVSGRTAEVAQAMHDLGQGISAQGQSVFLSILPDWAPHPIMQAKRRGTKTLDRLIFQMIAERRALGEDASPPDLLSMLMFARDEESGQLMSDTQLRDELVTLYIAGHETTAVLLAWVWVMLAQHPEAERKLHKELDKALGGRPPTTDDLPRLPYVEQVIKETLRLYPPAWFLFRQTLQPIQLNGDAIPRGSIVFLFPYANHRDPRWFERPDEFLPERWSEDFERSLPKGAYFPFGMGPRVCIGNGFAMMEAQLLAATIASRFRLEPLDEARPFKGTTTLSFAAPVRVRLHRR